ncbi:MAG: hypothetical protein ACQEP1_04135 [Nanobdellota archaeon]
MFRGKRGSHKVLIKLFGIILGLTIVMIIGLYFAQNNGFEAARRQYFAIDGAYMAETLMASPGPAWVNYSHKLDYDINASDGEFNVESNSREFVGWINVSVGSTGEENYFKRSDIIYLNDDPSLPSYSCTPLELNRSSLGIVYEGNEGHYHELNVLEFGKIDVSKDLPSKHEYGEVIIFAEGEEEIRFGDDSSDLACRLAESSGFIPLPDDSLTENMIRIEGKMSIRNFSEAFR